MPPHAPPRWWRRIKALGACPYALAWARRYKTYRNMIRGCRRRDWLVWLLQRHPVAWAEYVVARDAALAKSANAGDAAWAEYLRAALEAARAACLRLEVNRA